MHSKQELQHIPFFFIIGRPRSGTTLLRTLLDAHPNLLIPPESPVILNLYKKYRNTGKGNDKLLRQFFPDLLSQKKFKSWPLSKTVKNDILSAGDFDYQSLIKLVFLNYQSVFPKNTIVSVGDKNPNYSININKIFKIFPDAGYIHLLRDPRDHAASVMKLDFIIPSASLIAYRCKLAYNKIMTLAGKYPKQFLTLKYEDLVTSPRQSLEKICRFLSVDYTPDMLSYYNMKDEILTKFPSLKSNPFHKNLFQPVNASSVGKWKSSLSKKNVLIIEHICRDLMQAQGYKAEFPESSFITRFRIIPGFILFYLSTGLSHFIDLFPFFIRTRFRNSPSVLAGIYNLFFRKK